MKLAVLVFVVLMCQVVISSYLIHIQINSDSVATFMLGCLIADLVTTVVYAIKNGY